MDAAIIGQLGIGLPLGLAAVGSALGIGAAGRAAAGAWAREGREGKPLVFKYLLFVGMPLTQTLYAFLLLIAGQAKGIYDSGLVASHAGAYLSIGLGVGLAELFSAWMQGLIGAAGCRTLTETDGKGVGNIIFAMGIAETVGLLGFIFLWLQLPKGAV